MSEKIIMLDLFSPVDFFGINDTNLNLLKNYFPSIKLIARNDTIKILGNDTEIEEFEKKFDIIFKYFNKHGRINEDIISKILSGIYDINSITNESTNDNVLVYGKNGMIIKPLTVNQERLVNSCRLNDMVFVVGPAGTGKTYTAVALAV